MMMNCAYFIKNHFKSFVSSTTTKFAPNALFLDSIKDMTSKVFRKWKTKKISVNMQSYQFLDKNSKFSKECVMKRPNLGSFKSWRKRKI